MSDSQVGEISFLEQPTLIVLRSLNYREFPLFPTQEKLIASGPILFRSLETNGDRRGFVTVLGHHFYEMWWPGGGQGVV